MSGNVRQSFVVLCMCVIGCAPGDRDPDPAPSVAAAPSAQAPAVNPSARIPIEQAKGVVVFDPQRRARAFENGLVGMPPPAAVTENVAQTSVCHLPPGEPCDPPPPQPTVSARTMSTDVIRVEYTCGENATTLVRTSPTFETLPANCFLGVTSETGLTPGTTYCYAIMNDDGSLATPERCARTLFNPYVFHGPGLSQAESDQMAAEFDWTHTDPVGVTISTGSGPQTALYSMNILVKNTDDLLSIRGLGIHTQTQPLLRDEQDVWDGKVMQAMSGGQPVGVWITAIVPGPIYNDLRSQAIAAIASGHPIGIKAMVFRKINLPGAAFFPNPSILVSPLDPTFLGQQGLEFNGYSAVQCDPGPPRTCTIQQGLFGWLLRQLITIAVDIVEAVVDGVRQVIGAVEKLVRGEVGVTVQLVLMNTDEAFGLGEPTKSGWNAGAPLVLKNLPVRVYQGVAEFTGTTDANGFATVEVSKNLSGKVCVDLENERVTIIDTFTARRVCMDQKFSATSTPMTVTLSTTNKYANLLAAMTDAGDYLQTVMGFDMSRISVLTGWQSSLVTALNGGRSFTPCMGRMPNLTANIAIYSAGLVSPLLTALGEISEFLNAYDIVMDESDVRSRGVGVHEYGHAATCELLRNADQVKASIAWADVMVASMTGQAASDEQSMIAEGLADFLALQVVGGTNYFTGSNTRNSRSMDYCVGDSLTANDCLEGNAVRCDGAGCDRSTNIRWAASLLQDAFDRLPTDAADKANPSVLLPNDGSHWRFDGTNLVPSHASNQVSSRDSDSLQLPGPSISSLFSVWADNGDTLRYDSFFGALAQILKDEGYDVVAVCAMFAAHEHSGTCPVYVTDVFGTVPPPGGPPATGADRFAYALADQPAATSYETNAAYTYSGSGGAITVNRTAQGRYRVTFDGLPAWGPDLSASVAVTTYGSSTITCSVANFGTTTDASTVDVFCWDNASAAAADSQFSILLLGNEGMASPSAFLASGGPAPVPAPSPLLSWTSGSHAETVTHGSGVGSYLVNLGVGNAPLSAKIVTANGTHGGERCVNAQGISGGLEVRCYDKSGAPAEGMFYTLQLATGKPGRRFGFVFAHWASSPSYTPYTSTSFNSSGGPITITRTAIGHYLVELAGLQKQIGHTENVQVTAISGLMVTCNAVSWSSSPTGLQIAVECRKDGTSFVDSRYEVMVVE